MEQIAYCCPRCSSQPVLTYSNGEYSCGSCLSTWGECDGIPCFSPDTYWGEIPEAEMMELLQEIRVNGFDPAMARLQSREPGVFQFIMDPARADWRYGMVLHATDRVLDVGCGMGGNTFGLCDLVESVVSFDLSLARVKMVRERAHAKGQTNIQSFVGDFMSIPLPEHSFDVIVFNGILEWIGQNEMFADPYEVQRWVMKKCFRLLRPGGRMYVGIENRFSYSYLYPGLDHIGLRCTSWMPRWFARPYCKFRIGKDYRTYTHGKRGYERLFREAGFGDIRVIMPFPGYNDQRVLIPFDDVASLRYGITNLMGSLNWKKRFIKALSHLPGVLELYRYFFFSYDIYGVKPASYDSTS